MRLAMAKSVDVKEKQATTGDVKEIIWGRKINPKLLWGLYDAEPWVAAAVDEICRWTMALGWEIRPLVKNPSMEQKDQLLEFLDEPNDEDSLDDLIWDQCVDYQVLGDSFNEIERDNQGLMTALWSLDSGQMKIKTTDDGKIITGYKQVEDGKLIATFDVDEIFRLKRNARGRTLFGGAPMRPLFMSLVTQLFAYKWNQVRFENHGSARKAFIMDEEMGEEQVAFNDARLKEMKGVDHAYSDVMLWGNIKIETLDLTSQDMDFLNQIKLNREAILATWGVPPSLVGIIEAGNIGGGTGDSQMKKFGRGVIRPFKRKIGQNFNKKITQGRYRTGPGWGYRR